MKTNRAKPTPRFRAALQSDGTLELLVYEDIGQDWWSGEGVTAKTIKQAIDAAGPFASIAVRINSPGGDAFEGVAIFNLLRAQGKPIAVFVDGIAASAASVVAMAGDTRVMGAGAMLMIHNAWGGCVGYAEDMRKMGDTLDKVSTSVAETYVQRAGITAAKAKELMDAETWLSAGASLELGFATGIAEPETDDGSALALARSFKGLSRLKAVPEILRQQEDDEPADAGPACACDCTACIGGDCTMCTVTNCSAAGCLCGGSSDGQAAADLGIFELELQKLTPAQPDLRARQGNVCEMRPELGLAAGALIHSRRNGMSYAKELREKQARIAAQMRAIVDTAKKASRGLTSEERTQWTNMVAEFENNDQSIKDEERLVSIESALGIPANDPIAPTILDRGSDPNTGGRKIAKRDDTPHGKAFAKWLRGGMAMLSAEEQRLMQSRAIGLDTLGIQNAQTVTGSGGGYLIPQGFSEQLEEALKWYGGIIGEVDTFDTETGNPLPWPTDNDTAQKGRMLAINTQVTETDVTFGQVTFNAFMGSSDLILVPIQLMQDSYFDMDSYLARKLGTRLGRLVNAQCTVGTGGGTAPTGIQTAAVAAGLIVQGAVGTSTGIGYKDLVNVYHAVDPAYRDRPSAKYMFADSTLKVIRQLLDTAGRPLWQPGISAGFGSGFPPTILDRPFVVNNDMPAMAASANGVLFGDLSCYKLRRVAGGVTIMRLVERYADYLQVGFLGFMRFDGNLIDAGTHPVAVWQNSAT